jgi:uncharacterized protein HemY
MIKSNMAMNSKNFDEAEGYLKDSIKSKSSLAGEEFEGASYLQLGMLAMQKGDRKEAKKNLKQALAKGLPDDDSMAAALLQLSSIEIQGRQKKSKNRLLKWASIFLELGKAKKDPPSF